MVTRRYVPVLQSPEHSPLCCHPVHPHVDTAHEIVSLDWTIHPTGPDSFPLQSGSLVRSASSQLPTQSDQSAHGQQYDPHSGGWQSIVSSISQSGSFWQIAVLRINPADSPGAEQEMGHADHSVHPIICPFTSWKIKTKIEIISHDNWKKIKVAFLFLEFCCAYYLVYEIIIRYVSKYSCTRSLATKWIIHQSSFWFYDDSSMILVMYNNLSELFSHGVETRSDLSVFHQEYYQKHDPFPRNGIRVKKRFQKLICFKTKLEND